MNDAELLVVRHCRHKSVPRAGVREGSNDDNRFSSTERRSD